MSESSSPPQAESLQSPIQFFYVEHSGAETAATLAERLQDYDVVAMEYVVAGGKRAVAQEAANQITHATTAEQAHQLLIDSDSFFYYDKFKHTLMTALAGTNKEIILVDANSEDVPEATDMRNAAKAMDQGIPTEPTDTVMTHLKDMAHAISAMDGRREQLVAEQVRTIAAELEPGKRLAVFQGTAHTPTYLALKREGVNVERDFITGLTTKPDFPGTKQVYGLFTTLGRHLSMRPDTPVPESMWKRELINTYATYSTWDKSYEESRPYMEAIENALYDIDDEELQTLLDSIDTVRQETHPEIEENISQFRARIQGLLDERLGTSFNIAA